MRVVRAGLVSSGAREGVPSAAIWAVTGWSSVRGDDGLLLSACGFVRSQRRRIRRRVEPVEPSKPSSHEGFQRQDGPPITGAIMCG
jgi:hypothetical protein